MATRALNGDTGSGSASPVSRVRIAFPFVFGWLCISGLYTVFHFTSPRTPVVEVLRQLTYLTPFILALIGAFVCSLRADGRERRLWLGIAVATTLIFISEALVSMRVVEYGPSATAWSAASAVISIVAAVLFIGTLITLADIRLLSRVANARNLNDTIGVTLVVFGLVLWGVMEPLVAGYDAGEPGGNVVLAVFSTIGVLTCAATWVNFANRKGIRWRAPEGLPILGIGVYGFATALFPFWHFGAEVSVLSNWELPVEVMWMSGMWLIFAGAFMRLRMSEGERCFFSVPRLRPDERGWLLASASIAFVLGIPLFGYLGLAGDSDPVTRSAYLATAAGLTVVMVMRSVVFSLENDFLFRKAINDQLTELYGHRYFFERLGLEIDIARRKESTVHVLVFDIDGFSRVNASRGHAFGDETLRGAAGLLASAIRSCDIACHLGADKFAVIVPAASEDEVAKVAEGVRRAIAGVPAGDGSPLSVSCGYAGYPADSVERDDLVRKADGALYWAKYHGRDRVVAFDESVVESLSAADRIQRLEEQSHLGTVRALAAAVDARDPLTQFHSRNVAVLAVMLAEELGLNEGKRQLIEVAALLHDVGKIGISDRVLRKRGPLMAAEVKHIREHPGLGEKILGSTQLEEILPWVRHHHERWDGTGYPDGLAGEDIPFEARLLSVCDSYDAMTSGRPYRAALTSTAALQELDLCIGTQFDPVMAEAFIKMVGRRRLLRPETHSEREGGRVIGTARGKEMPVEG